MWLKIYMKNILCTSTGCNILHPLNSRFKEYLKTREMLMVYVEEKHSIFIFIHLFILFIYFWLHWVFVAARAFL